MTGQHLGRRLLAFVVAIALASAACSGDGGSDDTTAADDAADPEGVIRVGYDLVLQSVGGFQLDPAAEPTSANEALLYLIYGRLLRPTADGDLAPDLAESATNVDANTIEVVVRDGATFHDGMPFDAAAVEAGLERTIASGNEQGLGSEFFSLESVDVTGPNTVTLNIPDGTAPSWHDTFLGSWQTSIVKPDTDFSRPVGAGPFTVEEYQPEQSLVLAKYDGYWDAESITLGGVEFTHIASDQQHSA